MMRWIQPDDVPQRRVIAAMGGLFLLGLTGVALSPVLLVHAPVLLVALSPIHRHVLMVAPEVGLSVLLIVVVLRRLVGGCIVFAVGRSFGRKGLRAVAEKQPRLGRWGQWLLERLDGPLGIPLVALAPNATPVFAGASKMGFGAFCAATVFGQVWLVTATFFLADYLKRYIEQMLLFVQDWVFELTALTIGAVLIRLAYKRWRDGKVSGSIAGQGTSS